MLTTGKWLRTGAVIPFAAMIALLTPPPELVAQDGAFCWSCHSTDGCYAQDGEGGREDCGVIGHENPITGEDEPSMCWQDGDECENEWWGGGSFAFSDSSDYLEWIREAVNYAGFCQPASRQEGDRIASLARGEEQLSNA